MTGTGEAATFWVLGTLAVVAALSLLFAKKAVHAAIGMVTTMIVMASSSCSTRRPSSGSCTSSSTPAP